MGEWLDLGELYDRINDLLDMGLVDDAGELLDSYAPAYYGEWEIPYLRSRISQENGSHQEAIQHLRESLRLGGHNAETYLGLFHAHCGMGRMSKGARYLLRARSRFPRNEEVLASLIWYYGETNAYRQALSVYKDAQAGPIDDPDIHRNAGLVHQRLGDTDSAETCYRAAVALAPLSEELHDLLGDLYVMIGKARKAVALYEAFLARSPKNVHALSRLVFCLGQDGDLDKAEAVARRTVSLYPNSPVGYVDLAYVYLNRGATDEALREVDRALAVAPLEAEAYRVRAIVLSEQDRDREADQAYRAAISLAPDNAEVLRDYYHHLRKVGDYRKMEQVVQEVVRREKPYCVEDYWFLADHFWDEGRPLKAFHCLNRAHKNMPGETELLPPLVTVMLDRGHAGYAMPYLLGYALRSGWNDTMRGLARHRRLHAARARESLRFLRFYAERADRYREHAFRYYLSRALPYVPLALFPPAALLAWAGAGSAGVAISAAACLACYGLARVGLCLFEGPAAALLQRWRAIGA